MSSLTGSAEEYEAPLKDENEQADRRLTIEKKKKPLHMGQERRGIRTGKYFRSLRASELEMISDLSESVFGHAVEAHHDDQLQDRPCDSRKIHRRGGVQADDTAPFALEFLSANITSWASGIELLKSTTANVVLLQEHKICDQDSLNAAKRLAENMGGPPTPCVSCFLPSPSRLCCIIVPALLLCAVFGWTPQRSTSPQSPKPRAKQRCMG